MSLIENRVHQRVQCFNFPFNREFIPIWVFTGNGGVAGLVVNLSYSGIQLLTDTDEPLIRQDYDIVFLNDVDFEITTAPRCHVQHVWNEQTSTKYNTAGFIFTGASDAVVKHQLAKFQQPERPFLRCELRPTESLAH